MTLKDGLDQRDELYRLAEAINWSVFDEQFQSHYTDQGRPPLAIRRLTGLLILKQLKDLSDEQVCRYWHESPYAQFFCGEIHFQWGYPCNPSELTYFRKRIGEEGIKLIFEASVGLHQATVRSEDELVIDSTVQEANITYPTETKLRERIIERLWALGEQSGVSWERSYKYTVPRLRRLARQRSNRTQKARRKAILKLRTVARSLLRQYREAVPIEERTGRVCRELRTMERILTQSFSEPANERVHSLHDPTVRCIAKGKAHKKYEWGRKASFAMLAQSSVIVGVASFEDNLFDGDTLAKTIASATTRSGKLFKSALVDGGYPGVTRIGTTEIVQPYRRGPSKRNAYQKTKHRKRMRRRSAIEPVIGHLKNDYRMARCYLQGFSGSVKNAHLAAAAWNFRKWMRASALFAQIQKLCRGLLEHIESIQRRFFPPQLKIKLPSAA
jgi:IS5 family transposase